MRIVGALSHYKAVSIGPIMGLPPSTAVRLQARTWLLFICNGTHGIYHLALVTPSDVNGYQNENVNNFYEGQGCSHNCVRTASDSVRCLCPEAW